MSKTFKYFKIIMRNLCYRCTVFRERSKKDEHDTEHINDGKIFNQTEIFKIQVTYLKQWDFQMIGFAFEDFNLR